VVIIDNLRYLFVTFKWLVLRLKSQSLIMMIK